MLYKFTPLDQPPQKQENPLQVIFGGINLEDDFQSAFRVLNVSGRGLISPEVKMTQRVGADGVWLDSVRLPSRVIGVEAVLKAPDQMDWAYLLSAAVQAFYGDVRPLRFTDNPYYFYHAVFTGAKEFKDDRFQRIVTFNFLCVDPYAYGVDVLITYDGFIPHEIKMPTAPELLKVTLAGATDQLKITNTTTGRNIVLDTDMSFSANDVFEFRWGERPSITRNNQSVLPLLSIDSDFEHFTVKAHDQIVVTPNTATFEVHAREKVL